MLQVINISQRTAFVTGMFICSSWVCVYVWSTYTPTRRLNCVMVASAVAVAVVVCRHHHHLLLLLLVPLLLQSSSPTSPQHHIRNEINQIEFKIDEPCAANFIENSNCRMWQWLRRDRMQECFTFSMNAFINYVSMADNVFVNVYLYLCACVWP